MFSVLFCLLSSLQIQWFTGKKCTVPHEQAGWMEGGKRGECHKSTGGTLESLSHGFHEASRDVTAPTSQPEEMEMKSWGLQANNGRRSDVQMFLVLCCKRMIQ